MKTHTSQFKNKIKEFGREIDDKITYTLNDTEIELGSEELNSVSPHYEGAILKSVMKQLDIDSNVEIPIGTILTYDFGIKTGNTYEYINYGNYVVYSVEKQEDTNSYKITCYDKMLYAMKDYENSGITYPITIKNYLNTICNKIGLTYSNKDFANCDKTITNELYLDTEGNSLGYAFRDVLDEIAEVSGGTICINQDDELEVRYIKDVGELTEIVGSSLSITSDADTQMQEMEIEGNTTQATRDGKNLYNYKSATSVTSGVTTDNEGWITVTYDNTNGTANKYFNYWTSNLALSVNTNYAIITEIKNVSGGGSLFTMSNSGNSGQFQGSIGYSFGSLSNNAVKVEVKTTKTSFTNVTDGLRTYIQFQAGQSGSITFRISVLANTSITPSTFVYEAYGVSPSINYPSELVSVGYQNLFDGSSSEWSDWYIPEYNLNNRSFYLYFTTENMEKFTKGQQMTFSYDIEFNNVTGTSGEAKLFAPQIVINETLDNLYNGQWFNFSGQSTIYSTIPDGIYHMEHTFTLDTDRTNYVRYGFVPRINYWASGKFRVKNVQLQVGNKAGEFIDYDKYGICIKETNADKKTSQLYVLDKPLRSIGNIKDKLYVENGMLYIDRKIGSKTLNGTETWYKGNDDGGYPRYYTVITDAYFHDDTLRHSDKVKSDHFIANTTASPQSVYQYRDQMLFDTTTNLNTLALFKTWLSNNNVEVQYVLNEPYTEMLGAISLPILYKGINSINVIGVNNVAPKMSYISEFEEIDEEMLKDVNVNFGEKFGLVNTLILSRGGEADKITLSMPNDLPDDEKVAIQITDNQIMNSNDRDEFMPQLLNVLYGLEYYINDFSSTGIGYLDLCDRYQVNIANNKYSCVMFNNQANRTQGFEELIYTDMQEENETEYKYTSSTDKGITQANIIAKKNEATIIETTQKLDTTNNRLNAVETQQTETDRTINIISTHIDNDGNVTEVTTTTGFTFNAEGMTIANNETDFRALHRNTGTYYYDGTAIVGQYTKDGSKQKDLELFGVYYYGKDDINEDPMFVAQLYTDENGEECFGHFYNRGD